MIELGLHTDNHKTKWSGAVSIECHGSDDNTKASVDWMRGVLKGLKK